MFGNVGHAALCPTYLADLKTYGATIGVAIITISALFVHKRIEHLISTLKEL